MTFSVDKDWQPISRSRLVRFHPSGFDVIIPKGIRNRVPLDCPICHLIMRDSDDSRSFREFGCCSWCSSRWAEPNREKWLDGWRPDLESVNQEIERRQSLLIRLPIR